MEEVQLNGKPERQEASLPRRMLGPSSPGEAAGKLPSQELERCTSATTFWGDHPGRMSTCRHRPLTGPPLCRLPQAAWGARLASPRQG